MAVYPYGVKCLQKGVQVSYGATRRYVSNANIADIFYPDWSVGAADVFISRGVARYDNLSVTMTYRLQGGGAMSAYLVKASPFVTI